MRAITRSLGALAGVLALLFGGCSGTTPAAQENPSAEPSAAATPITMTNAWGSAEIPANPQRVAVVSGGDRSIAYALGVVPVVEWSQSSGSIAPYVTEARGRLGITEPTVFDGTDGTDYATIAEAEPDVILAMNSYSMDEDYDRLAKIAPVITFEEKNDAYSMLWQDRLLRAGLGLGMEAKANEVIASNAAVASAAQQANPGFTGTSYTYLIVHPEQITYSSFAEQDKGPLDDLGLVKPANAATFNSDNNAVSLENLDQADADIILIAYPFGDEGLLSRAELEKNPLWQKIPAVAAGRWAIVDSASGLASDIAYPDALSYPWVIEHLTPVVAKAIAAQ